MKPNHYAKRFWLCVVLLVMGVVLFIISQGQLAFQVAGGITIMAAAIVLIGQVNRQENKANTEATDARVEQVEQKAEIAKDKVDVMEEKVESLTEKTPGRSQPKE